VNKEKLTKIKNQIKKHAPEIILSVTTVAATVYAVSVKLALANEAKRFPETDATYLALNGETMDRLQKGETPHWIVEGHLISLAYDPDC
jgi:hypothetical protein